MKVTPEEGGRKSKRASFNRAAWIEAAPTVLLPRFVSDNSSSGAQLYLDQNCAVPNRFAVRLTEDGRVRRDCRVVWQNGGRVATLPSAACEPYAQSILWVLPYPARAPSRP